MTHVPFRLTNLSFSLSLSSNLSASPFLSLSVSLSFFLTEISSFFSLLSPYTHSFQHPAHVCAYTQTNTHDCATSTINTHACTLSRAREENITYVCMSTCIPVYVFFCVGVCLCAYKYVLGMCACVQHASARPSRSTLSDGFTFDSYLAFGGTKKSARFPAKSLKFSRDLIYGGSPSPLAHHPTPLSLPTTRLHSR